MNKTFLFIAVFMIAYGGFFYHKYTSNQDTNVSKTTAMTKSPVQTMASSSAYSAPIVPTKMLSAGIDHHNSQLSAQKKSVSSGEYKLKDHAQNTRNSSPDIVNQTQNDNHSLTTYQPRTSSSYPRNKLSAFTYTSATSNNVSQTSSFLTSNSATSNTSTAPEPRSDASSRQTTSVTTASGNQHTVTTGSANDSAPPSNNTVNDVATPDTDQWATPNCPVQLANGSTKADADTMQQSYGCRYLKYCRNLNDGKNGFTCWWGFYSS